MTEANPTMQCSFPSPLTEDQLTDALDGAANSSVREHLERCSYCTMRLAEAHRTETAIQRQLSRWDAPTVDELADYVMGMLDDLERRRIDAYLRTSPSARAEVDNLRTFLNMGTFPPCCTG